MQSVANEELITDAISEGKFRLGKSERKFRRCGGPYLPFAASAKKGAPQAKQIADKFHLVKNLREGLKELMARKQKVLPEVEGDSSDGIPLRARGKQPERVLEEVLKPEESEKHWRSMSPEPRHLPASSVNDEDAPSPSQVSRANRYARYEAVRALHQQAISEAERVRAGCTCPGRRCGNF